MANPNENMTREEREVAIDKLKADIKYWENTSVSTDHLHMAIKALAQESILDRLRAEIEQNAYPIVHEVNNHELGMTLYGILQVIDKYKADVREEPCENAENREEEDLTR